MPVLNGMRHVDILEERFGKKAVVGGVCKVATTVDSGGRIVQLATLQELVYGEWDGAVSARMEALDAFMRGGTMSRHRGRHGSPRLDKR
jgi:2-dehydropantoate 2-reductase